MRKIVIFAFRGDSMCFIHVLLNSLDFYNRGMGGSIVMEGEAVKLVPEIASAGHPLNALYREAAAAGLFEGACRACSTKLGVAEAVAAHGLKLIGDMSGHPSMSRYLDNGFEIVTM